MILKSHAKKYDIRHKTKTRNRRTNSLVRVSVMTGKEKRRKKLDPGGQVSHIRPISHKLPMETEDQSFPDFALLQT